MTSFKGINCPVCNVPFSDADDIVVCPDCGAPYHRACYKQIGHCMFDHAAGQGWQAPEQPQVEQAAETTADNINESTRPEPEQETSLPSRCPRCGNENPPGSLFCNTCGASLMQHGAHPGHQTAQTGSGAYNSFFTAASGLKPEDEVADDVTVEEAARFTHINNLYYVPIFKRIKEHNRSRFNFSAMVFSGGWLLYRKQYTAGIIVTVVTTLMTILSTLALTLGAMPIMVEMFTNCGIDPNSVSLSYDQQMLIAAELQNYPEVLTYAWLSFLPLIINGIISLVLGFTGNRMYYKHTVKTIRKARETYTDRASDGYKSELTRRGAVNPKIILLIAILHTVLNYLPYFLG